MKVAIISDIHANWQALQAVIAHAHKVAPDAQFWCLGDVFDRGPQPLKVWETLENLKPSVWIAGNHDWGLIGHENDFKSEERETLDRQKRLLESVGNYKVIAKQIDEMPVMVSPVEAVYLAHGSFGLLSPEITEEDCVREYLVREIQIERSWLILRAFGANPKPSSRFANHTIKWTLPALMIVGHSHVRAMFGLRPTCRNIPVQTEQWYDLSLDPETPLLINPGSVGFSRNVNDRGACYALLDWNATRAQVCFFSVPYCRAETIQLLDDYAYPPEFIKQLEGPCES